MKTYKEYLAASKPITRDPAPAGAMPKCTKGDSHRYRRKVKAMQHNGDVFTYLLPTKKDGTLNKAALKRMRSIEL
jgi:hypothetical protein